MIVEFIKSGLDKTFEARQDSRFFKKIFPVGWVLIITKENYWKSVE